MTYNEFCGEMRNIASRRAAAQNELLRVDREEAALLESAGVRWYGREPGFAWWTADWTSGYYNTPFEVMKVKPVAEEV